MRPLLLVLCLFAGQANAESHLIFSGYSKHLIEICNSTKCTPLNENNYGLGIAHNAWSVGTYYNSYNKQSYYVGYQKKLAINKFYETGYGATLVTGYDQYAKIIPLPYTYMAIKLDKHRQIQTMMTATATLAVVFKARIGD